MPVLDQEELSALPGRGGQGLCRRRPHRYRDRVEDSPLRADRARPRGTQAPRRNADGRHREVAACIARVSSARGGPAGWSDAPRHSVRARSAARRAEPTRRSAALVAGGRLGVALSGVDLARVALVTARKNRGNTRTAKAKPRTMSVVRREGREPMGLGAVSGALVAERAWEIPAAGATLRQRWEVVLAAGSVPTSPGRRRPPGPGSAQRACEETGVGWRTWTSRRRSNGRAVRCGKSADVCYPSLTIRRPRSRSLRVRTSAVGRWPRRGVGGSPR